MSRRDLPPTRPERVTSSDGRAAGERAVAIALSHDIESDSPPVVTAKGAGKLAEEILRAAFENDVKVRTDPELAKLLSIIELDCEIPVEAYAAVAEILTYVYAANRRLRNDWEEQEMLE